MTDQTKRKFMDTRRTFLKTSVAATAVMGMPKFMFKPAHAADSLAPGMTGGPTGFEGADRFQYNSTMSEGRAIEGVKALKAAGDIPAKLSMLVVETAIGQITQPFPAGAPSVKEVWERETGIELDIIGAPEQDIFKKVMQDITTGGGTFDIYTGAWNSVGDVVSSGGAMDLSDLVAKYQPDWGDPVRGTPTPELEKLLYTYNDKYYSVALDGDFQTWFYLKGIYDKPEVQEAFLNETGTVLATPDTWEEVDRISKFFNGKDFGNGTMYGNGNLMSPFWGLSTFYARLASMDFPNNYFFDEDANPQMNTDLAVQCCEEHVRSLEWASPDALSWTFAEAYNAIWNLLVPHMATFTNMVKFGDGFDEEGLPKSKATGLLSAHLPPGRRFGDKINRRAVLYFQSTAWVSRGSKNQEAAYLFLQWLSSTRTMSWMTGNPAGVFDPMLQANFAEPLVEQAYHSYSMTMIPETMKRAAPTINFAGQNALDNALDEELQAALTGQKTARQAMDATQSKWERIIKRQKRNGIEDAIKASRKTWPTMVDPA